MVFCLPFIAAKFHFEEEKSSGDISIYYIYIYRTKKRAVLFFKHLNFVQPRYVGELLSWWREQIAGSCRRKKLSEQDTESRMGTPVKFDIDTQHAMFEAGDTYSKASCLVSMLGFRGCNIRMGTKQYVEHVISDCWFGTCSCWYR